MSAVDTGHVLGPLAQIPPGEGRAFEVDGEQVAVFRLKDGGVRAQGAACPHRGGPLADGQIDASVVVCPLHQHAFELSTGACLSGAESARRYPVTVDAGGNVVVAVTQ